METTNLKDLARPAGTLDVLNLPENGVNLVDDLAGDEAAEVVLHVLHERHPQQRDAGLYGGQDLPMSRQRVIWEKTNDVRK